MTMKEEGLPTVGLQELTAARSPSAICDQQLGADLWRPMETAPKDQIILLAVAGGSERRVFVAQADYPPSGFRWITNVGTDWAGLHSGWEPTHWMPLPDPPTASSAEG